MKDENGDLSYLVSMNSTQRLTDHLGSVVAITDDEGTLTSQQRYLPFGGIRNIASGPITSTDYGYTGQRNLDEDPSTGSGQRIGLMDYKARFYSPVLNRFIQPDSIIPHPFNSQSYNRYSYVYNNPTTYIDPTGHGTICNEEGQCFINGKASTVTIHLEDYAHEVDDEEEGEENGGGSSDNSDNNLDFTGYLADVLTARTTSLEYYLMQNSHYGWASHIILLYLECPNCRWDIKVKMGEVSKGVGLCNANNGCAYYDYSTPGNIQFGYLAGLLEMNKELVDKAGGLVNTIDFYILDAPDATYGGCWTCDDPRDQAAVDFGYNLASSYPNGMTRGELATELGNSPLTASFQPPQSTWQQPYPASPGPTIYNAGDFDNE